MGKQEKKPIIDLREIPSRILISILVSGLIHLGTIVLSLFTAVKIASIFKLTQVERVLLIISIVLLGLAVSLKLLRKKFAKNVPQFEPASSDYDVLQREFTHKYIEKEKIVHTRRWKLKALRNGLATFNDKFFWSGEKWEFRSTIDDHSVTQNRNRNLYEYYTYHFDRTLKKGDTIDIEVEWDLYGQHKYFISTPIEEPTGLLILNIIFPHDWNIKKIYLVASGIQASKIPDETEVQIQDGRYRWEIKNPKLYHHYEIKWNIKT